MVWEVHPTERAFHPQDAWFWRPDADIADVAISVSSFESVLGHLRGMPEGEISRKLGEMNVMRRILSFEVRCKKPISIDLLEWAQIRLCMQMQAYKAAFHLCVEISVHKIHNCLVCE